MQIADYIVCRFYGYLQLDFKIQFVIQTAVLPAHFTTAAFIVLMAKAGSEALTTAEPETIMFAPAYKTWGEQGYGDGLQALYRPKTIGGLTIGGVWSVWRYSDGM